MTQITNTPIAVMAIGMVPTIDLRFDVNLGRFDTNSSHIPQICTEQKDYFTPYKYFAKYITQRLQEFVRNVL